MQLNNYYQVGGSLKYNHPTYVYRQADRQLLEYLKAREYCYVFNSRQMGKSSLRIQTIKKLRKEGIKCASLDLSAIGTCVESNKWYYSVCFQLLSSLDLEDEVDFHAWWSQYKDNTEVQKLELFIDKILLARISQDLVIFLDEIDSTIKLNFKDDFFALLRACFNKRAENQNYDRLTICLLGVATPADLIQDKDRTPFNISRPIELRGFTLEEASPALIPGFAAQFSQPEDILKKVLYWTGGQPFLTQKLCKIILNNATTKYPNIPELVEKNIIENWEEKDQPEHLKTLCDRLLRNENKAIKLLDLYQKILKNTTLANTSEVVIDNSTEQTELRLSGITVKRDGYLQVYNPIYQAVFNLTWVKDKLDNLRPYAGAINNWLASEKDPSFLLRYKELKLAISWAKDKRIGDSDREFLYASQESIVAQLELKEKAQTEANFILAKAHQQANQRAAFGGILGGLLICVSLFGGYLNIREARKESNTAQKAKTIIQGSYDASEQFKSGQINGLLTAMKAAQDLLPLIKKRQLSSDYQTQIVPLFTLQNILFQIRESNQIESRDLTTFTSLNFSPERNIFASGDDNGNIIIWQANGTKKTSFQAHDVGITAVKFSPDGKIIASVDANRVVKLWQTNGTLIKTLPQAKERLIGIAFSSDGNSIATATRHGTITMWQKDGTLIKTFTDRSRGITAIDLSPSDPLIAVATDNKEIEIWQLNGKLIKTIPAHDDIINSLNFSPNGNLIASASNDSTIKLWRKDGRLIREISGDNNWVTDVIFSPDGQKIASSTTDRTVKIWRTDGTILATLKGHLGTLKSIAFNQDSNILASLSDRTIKLWQLDRNLNSSADEENQVKAIAFSRDGKIALSVSFLDRITLNNLDRSEISNLRIDPDFFITTVALNQNGKIIAFGNNKGEVRLYNRNGQRIETWSGKKSFINSIKFSPNGKIIAVGNDDGEIELRTENGTLVNTLTGHLGWINSIVFSPNGKIIASGSDDGTIKLWQKDGTLIKTLNHHTKAVKSLDFSPDGEFLVSASSDRTLKIWNKKGDLIETITGHSQSVNSVVFSPNGEFIISGSDRGTIKLWQKDGSPINSLNTGDRPITSLTFSEDGKNLAFGTNDGNINLLSFQLEQLLDRGCQWLDDYFITHPEQLQDFPVCQ